jgi:hypothetical protein
MAGGHLPMPNKEPVIARSSSAAGRAWQSLTANRVLLWPVGMNAPHMTRFAARVVMQLDLVSDG